METWVLAALGALFVGLAKGGVPGVGNVTPVLYVMAFGGFPSIGILLPILMLADSAAVVIYRKQAHWRHCTYLLGWMLIGIIIAYGVMHYMNSDNIVRLIGLIIIGMATAHFTPQIIRGVKQALALKQSEAACHRPRLDFFVQTILGIASGFSSMAANSAGPSTQLYLARLKLNKWTYVGTMAWVFFFANWIKIPFFLGLELITLDSLMTSAKLMPFALAGVLIAPKLLQYMHQGLFDCLVWFFIIVGSLKMIFG